MRVPSCALFLLLAGACAGTPEFVQPVKRLVGAPPLPPHPPDPPSLEDIANAHGKWRHKSEPLVDPPKADVLWRGEIGRTVEQVKEAGGFDSHAKRIFARNHPAHPDILTHEEFHEAASLYYHGTKLNTISPYISTSRSKVQALKFAAKPNAKAPGILYKIEPTPRMVDVEGSLGGNRFYKNAHEEEVAGVWHIPFDKIISYQEVQCKKGGDEVQYGEIVMNPEYRPGPRESTYSSHYELAGWPEGSVAFEHEAYKPYQGKPVEEYLQKFLDDHDYDLKIECRQSRKRDGGPCTLVDKKLLKGEDAAEKQRSSVDKQEHEHGSKPADSEKALISAEQHSALHEEYADKHFTNLLKEHGPFPKGLSERPESLGAIKSIIKGHIEAHFGSFKGIAKSAHGVVALVMIPVYINNVWEAFHSNMTGLEKASVVAAPIPIIGCAVKAMADDESGPVDKSDVAICLLEDLVSLDPYTFILVFPLEWWREERERKYKLSFPYHKEVRKRHWQSKLDDIKKTIASEAWETHIRDQITAHAGSRLSALANITGELDVLELAMAAGNSSLHKDDLATARANALQRTCASLQAVERFFQETLPGQVADSIEKGGRAMYWHYIVNLNSQLVENWSQLEEQERLSNLALLDGLIQDLQTETGPAVDRAEIERLVRESSRDHFHHDQSLCKQYPSTTPSTGAVPDLGLFSDRPDTRFPHLDFGLRAEGLNCQTEADCGGREGYVCNSRYRRRRDTRTKRYVTRLPSAKQCWIPA